MEQLTLDTAGPVGPIRNDLEESYRAWLLAHPRIFALYERFALEAVSKGKKFSISLLTERIRWEARMTWDQKDEFKINNNYRAYLARDLVAKHPEYAAMLELRAVRAQEHEA